MAVRRYHQSKYNQIFESVARLENDVMKKSHLFKEPKEKWAITLMEVKFYKYFAVLFVLSNILLCIELTLTCFLNKTTKLKKSHLC